MEFNKAPLEGTELKSLCPQWGTSIFDTYPSSMTEFSNGVNTLIKQKGGEKWKK